MAGQGSRNHQYLTILVANALKSCGCVQRVPVVGDVSFDLTNLDRCNHTHMRASLEDRLNTVAPLVMRGFFVEARDTVKKEVNAIHVFRRIVTIPCQHDLIPHVLINLSFVPRSDRVDIQKAFPDKGTILKMAQLLCYCR